MNKTLYLFLATILFASCVKDKPNPDTYTLPNATHRGIIVCNEGSYGNNNAELSFIDLETNSSFNQLFRTANNKSMGDVAQSISLINGNYYIPVNNSNKILVVNAQNFSLIAEINNIKSPRYITQVNPTKAYVSSLYFPSVYVIDLNTNSLLKTITVDHPNTERMLSLNGYCYVTNWDTASNLVYKINTITDAIDTKIQLPGRASHDIVLDKNNMLWVLSGNKYKNKNSWLSQINPVSNKVIKSFPFHASEDPFRLTMHPDGITMFYININYNGAATDNGLYLMNIYGSNLPVIPRIQARTNSYFWAIGIDSVTNHIFLSDPKGFTQQSTVYEYSYSGAFLREFNTGIGANTFLFK